VKVLLSIKPEYAERIFEGTKRFEFRRVGFKQAGVKTVVVYATLPVGKVIGEFTVGRIIESSPSDLWEKTKEHSGISRELFHSYFAGRESAIAIGVHRPKRYRRPLSISSVSPSGIAPQSFCYLE
jgi:predicted transcriptional regulator